MCMMACIQSWCFDHAKGFNKEGNAGGTDLVEGQSLHVYVICRTLRA